jgi:hypothetical protein
VDRILAEWRALERVVEQADDRDDEEAIRERIDQLRGAYRVATGAPPEPEIRAPQQLTLPLTFAPRVVASRPQPGEVEP